MEGRRRQDGGDPTHRVGAPGIRGFYSGCRDPCGQGQPLAQHVVRRLSISSPHGPGPRQWPPLFKTTQAPPWIMGLRGAGRVGASARGLPAFLAPTGHPPPVGGGQRQSAATGNQSPRPGHHAPHAPGPPTLSAGCRASWTEEQHGTGRVRWDPPCGRGPSSEWRGEREDPPSLHTRARPSHTHQPPPGRGC